MTNDDRDKLYSILQSLEPFEMLTEFENNDVKVNNSINTVDDMKIEDVFISYIDSLDYNNKETLKEYVLQKYKTFK